MKAIVINGVSLYNLVLYFFIYSFLGWVMEVAFASLKTGKFVNRGFLAGPVCPIYGAGMALAMIALNSVRDKWYLLFVGGALLATALEFLTGFVLEKLFKTKWWDYSKEPFNIRGYVCLRFTLLWGLAILLVFNTVVVQIEWLVNILPIWLGYTLMAIFAAAFIADFVITILQLVKIGKHVALLQSLSETMHVGSDKIGAGISKATLAVKGRVEIAENKLKNTRLGKAFPELKKKFDEVIHKSHNDSDEQK